MNDLPKVETNSVSDCFRVVDARSVEVQQVHDFQTLLDGKINFGSLRQAVMINDKLLIGSPISVRTDSRYTRQ